MKLHNFAFALTVMALFHFLQLALPTDGSSWASNTNHYFLGAEVYLEDEIRSMKNGTLKELSDGTRPTDPQGFAEHVIESGTLSGFERSTAARYYILPRLHPKLDMLRASIGCLFIGVVISGFMLWKTSSQAKSPAPTDHA